jgi:hypothetical protein
MYTESRGAIVKKIMKCRCVEGAFDIEFHANYPRRKCSLKVNEAEKLRFEITKSLRNPMAGITAPTPLPQQPKEIRKVGFGKINQTIITLPKQPREIRKVGF